MRNLPIAILIFLSPISAKAASYVVDLPRLPADAALHTWGDSPEVDLLRAATPRVPAAPLFMDYPGQRDVYTALPEGAFDVTRVDTDVYIDIDNDGVLTVETRIALVALEDSVMKLEFYLEFPELLEVSESSGLALEYKKVGDILKVTFQEALPVEEEVELYFHYSGEMDCEVQFMLATCKLVGPWKYVTHSQFLPYLGGPGEIFTGDMTLWISGEGYKKWHAGGTGTSVGSTVYPEQGTKAIRFQHLFPTSLYAWSASKMNSVHGYAGEIPISATAQNPQIGNMHNILSIVQDVLAYYSEVYTYYPWNNLDVVAMPNSFSGGFGPLSTIFVMKGVLDATPDNNSIYGAMSLLSHEIGHEWWGNLVEMADSTAVVLSEGLAEFSSNLFMEQALGGSRYFFVENSMTYTYTVPHDEEPIMVSPFVYSSPYYYQVAYQKGAAVIDMLRLEIGDQAVLDGLKLMTETYFMEYAYPEELFQVFEEVSGQDLDYFYQQWMAGRGVIRAIVGATCAPGSDECRLQVKQKSGNGQGFFQFNLPVRIYLRDGSTTELVLRVDDWEIEEVLPVKADDVQRILIDPRRQLARILRPALPGDIDLNGVVDGADLVHLSFAYQVNLVVASDWGEYFYANSRYHDLADMADDDEPGGYDGRVNQVDLDLYMVQMGIGETERQP
jgi:hypothetical protein